jgi:uncharacterized protein (DUF697 family)
MAQIDQRISPSDTRYAAADVRGFITDALNTAPAVEIVQELLVTHVEGKLLHPSVVQEELAGLIQDIVGAATHADWIAITTGLINDAREALLDDEPATTCAR